MKIRCLSNKKGFTLAELLIVIAIIGVLVAVSIPVFTSQKEKAKEATCAANRRSLFSAVMNEQISSDQSSNMEKVKAAADTLGATANGYYVTGLCPDHGTITIQFYDDGEVDVSCSVHDVDSGRFAQNITNVIINNRDSISRGNTTLADYLKRRSNNHIDSEAGDNSPGASGSWANLIKGKMAESGSPLLYQGWALNYSNSIYTVVVTTGGSESLTSAKNGDYISVLKYTYDNSGNKISAESGTMKVVVQTRDDVSTYNRLDITTPSSFKLSG